MAYSVELAGLVAELLAPLGRVDVRRMFSGGGVFCEGLMIGIIVDDTLYLKGDETTSAAFEREGCGRFSYSAKSRTVTLPYWRAPERLLDEPDEIAEWGRRALTVARTRAAAKRPATGRKKANGGGRAPR